MIINCNTNEYFITKILQAESVLSNGGIRMIDKIYISVHEKKNVVSQDKMRKPGSKYNFEWIIDTSPGIIIFIKTGN